MATKQQVIDHIKNEYVVQFFNDGTFKFELKWEGRSQGVYGACTDSELQLTSAFALKTEITAAQALRHNESMFGVVELETVFSLKHNVLIENLDDSEIDQGIRSLAFYADEYESRVSAQDGF